MAPVAIVLALALISCLFCWIASLISRDTSWVDRLWSVLPFAYVWVFAASADFTDPRLTLMAGLATVWGARLTFNFARRGGYTGMEDYRWAILRQGMKPWQFQIFNLFFIVLFQNLLLVLISLPALTAFNNSSAPLGILDLLLGVLFLACTVGETVADQQQWNFQKAKRADIAAGYVFNWTIVGPILLTVLFIGSTRFTEKITRSRYPEYAQYQKNTSAIIPWR